MGVTRRSRHSAEEHLARPTADGGWEVWTLNNGTPPRFLRRAASLAEKEDKSLRLIGLPTSDLIGFSRWMQTSDDALLPDLVQAFLDRHGLTPKSTEGKSVAITPLFREETRTLVFIRILSASVPQNVLLPQIENYEPSAEMLDLPANGLVLWKENGRLAAVFSRDGKAAHVQSFADVTLTPEVARELLCTRLELETEGVLKQFDGIELRGEFPPEDCDTLGGILGAPVTVAQIGDPAPPVTPSGLLPPLAAQLRKKVARKQQLKRILFGAAAVYVFALVTLILNVAWLALSNEALAKKIAVDRPTAEAIQATSRRWRALEPAVNPAFYPVEILYQSAKLLPVDGVRFTLFELNANRITIRGEANNAAAAFKLVEDIKAQPDLSFFKWEMPRPNILPNDKAEFQIQGTSPDA
ncbi:MAG TPA: hypothetical protein VIT91_05810 [Chthoniobacterales bacterium]